MVIRFESSVHLIKADKPGHSDASGVLRFSLSIERGASIHRSCALKSADGRVGSPVEEISRPMLRIDDPCRTRGR